MSILTRLPTEAFSKTFALTGLAVAISLAGCSSSDPDSGSSQRTTAISGLAVDGYIAGATVYVDYNNDGRKGPGEPSALTDKDGYFSTSKDGNTDYCADDATSMQVVHCLRAIETGSGFVLRTFGGFDVYTGEPFTGSLAKRVSIENNVVGNQMLSPLTSMLVDVGDVDDQTTLLGFFGLGESDLDADFLDSAGYTELRVKAAIKLHKIVTLFSEVFTEQYEEFGEERSFPETPNAIIYKALAESLANSNVLDELTLATAFNNAQTAIRALYENDDDLNVPGSVSGTSAVQNALAMIDLIDDAIPTDEVTSFDDIKARVIGVETVLKKMLDGDDVSDAIDEAGDPDSDLYVAIKSALSGGDVDFTALTEVDFSDPQYDDISVTDNTSFANMGNTQLFVSFEDDDDNASGSGYFFFNGTQESGGGSLKVCLKFDDGDEFSSSFEETDGVLLSGNWLTLGDSRLILNLAGALSLNLTDKGSVDDDQRRYSLSYGGKTRSWLSDDGLLDELESQNTVTQPTNDAECATLLASSNNA